MSWGLPLAMFGFMAMGVGLDHFGRGLLQDPASGASIVFVLGWAFTFFCGLACGMYGQRHR